MACRRATIHRCGRAAGLVLVPLLLGACAAQTNPSPAATAGAAAGTAQLRITPVRVGASLPSEGGDRLQAVIRLDWASLRCAIVLYP